MNNAPSENLENQVPNTTVIELNVDAGQHSAMRLDQYIAQQVENASRSKVKEAIKEGWVLVNGKTAKASYLIQPFDCIFIELPKPPPPEAKAEDIPLDVVFEDEFLLVVNKPAGMVVHPAFGNWTGTLVNAVLHHVSTLENWESEDKEQSMRPGIVHRLDKDTSGLLVIAKDEKTHAHLAKQFAEHSVDRNYWALVWGRLPESGSIVADLGRDKRDRKKITIYPDGEGKHAITHFEVLEHFGDLTLAKISLETGRTHQIRVHFAAQNHPVFGDRTYGGDSIRFGSNAGNRKKCFDNCFELLPRQALHAKTLGFTHPNTGKRIRLDSKLPEDMCMVLTKMRALFNGQS